MLTGAEIEDKIHEGVASFTKSSKPPYICCLHHVAFDIFSSYIFERCDFQADSRCAQDYILMNTDSGEVRVKRDPSCPPDKMYIFEVPNSIGDFPSIFND